MVDKNLAMKSEKSEKIQKPIDLEGIVIRTRDGSVDVQATHVRFSQELSAFIQAEKADSEVIAKAVKLAFETRGATRLSMPQLLHYTMEQLDVDMERFNEVRERVANFVRNNTKLFKIDKGKGGGVSVVEEEAPAPMQTPTLPVSSAPASGSIRPRSTH